MTSPLLCLLAILLGVAGGRAAIEHHSSDRALMGWSVTLLVAAGASLLAAVVAYEA